MAAAIRIGEYIFLNRQTVNARKRAAGSLGTVDERWRKERLWERCSQGVVEGCG